jgi:hypothetical protein
MLDILSPHDELCMIDAPGISRERDARVSKYPIEHKHCVTGRRRLPIDRYLQRCTVLG